MTLLYILLIDIATMYIKEITLKNYRNYKDLRVSFGKNVNVFIGKNAQGKTNLLESIYVTSTGKSFRTNRDKELIRFDESPCEIHCVYQREYERSVDIIIDEKEKKGFIDGVKIEKQSQILGNVLLTVFSPEDLKIVKEEAEKRRNFINRELCQIKLSYYRDLVSYNRTLKQRNRYLKEEKIDDNFLDILDEQLIKYGIGIIKERKKFIQKINQKSKEIHFEIAKEDLEIHYDSSIKYQDIREDLEERYREELKMARGEDKTRRYTRIGPHKDDLPMTVEGRDVRKFASQGQQRSVALALKMAEIEIIKEEKKENPILLLDDVLSELDQSRQEFLIESLKNIQTFITTTHLPNTTKGKLTIDKQFVIEGGTIK